MMPFDGGIEALPNGTLVFSVGAAFLYLLMLDRPPSWRRTAAKTASTGLLAVLALIEGGPALLVAALVLSAAGDAFLAHEGERPFTGGLASFLLAHVAYIWLFLIAGGGMAAMLGEPWRLALAALAVVLAVVLLRFLLPAVGPALRVPVAIYALAILGMMLAAATMPAPPVLFGAALFVLSDGLLAIDRFLVSPAAKTTKRLLSVLVWTLYYAAQLAITLGFLLS